MDGAYGLFLKREAPLVWSYTTSQAYHEEHGDLAKRYRAILFEDGQPVQVEGAMLVKGAFDGAEGPQRLRLARRFLEFLLTRDVQERIPHANWMYPVTKEARLPDSYAHLPHPKLVRIVPTADDVDRTMTEWSRTVQGVK